MNFKKGDKTVYVPTLGIIAGAVVVTDVVRNICKTVVKKSKKQQQFEKGTWLYLAESLLFLEEMMKKKLITLILSTVVLLSVLSGCGTLDIPNTAKTEKAYDTEDENIDSMFVEVEQGDKWKIVYDKETKVMYSVSDAAYNDGNFTLLVDENGNPKLWDGE